MGINLIPLYGAVEKWLNSPDFLSDIRRFESCQHHQHIPVTQSGQSRGFLIRWSWVQIPSGVPITRIFVLARRSNSFTN